MGLSFSWNAEKAAINLSRHGVSFEEASTVFGDPLSVTVFDPAHSDDESRFVIVGQSFEGKLVVVVHSEFGREYKNYWCATGYTSRTRNV